MRLHTKAMRLLAPAAVLLALALCLAVPARAADPGPKHVILIIADGMSLANEVAASRYLFGRDDGLAMQAFPYRNYVSTWDLTTYKAYDSYPEANQAAADKPKTMNPLLGYNLALGGDKPYPLFDTDTKTATAYFLTPRQVVRGKAAPAATDSASAATALNTGMKTEGRNINWRAGYKPGARLATIAQKMRDQLGAAMGLVSTVAYTQATPAAVCTHNAHRKNEAPNKRDPEFSGLTIAEEIILQNKPEVVIGGGAPSYYRKDGKPLLFTPELTEVAKRDFVWVERLTGVNGGRALARAADQAAARGGRLFGVFGGAYSNMGYPVPVHRPGSPEVRDVSPENPNLAEMMLAALTVLSPNPKGFFLMGEQGDLDWANHSNDFAGMIGCVYDLDRAVKAVVAFVDRPGDDLDWGNTLLIVTADHATGYLRFHKKLGKGELPEQKVAEVNRYGFKTWYYPNGEVSYATDYHTNELVSLYAKGAGLELFKGYEGAMYPGTRLLDNTQVNQVMSRFAGLK